jgi:hypothetical protein
MNYDNHNNDNNNAPPNNIGVANDWRLRTLYINTEHLCAPKTDKVLTSDVLFAQRYRPPQAHPSSVPVILKDTTRPYTYYTMKSYGHAQDNNYYVSKSVINMPEYTNLVFIDSKLDVNNDKIIQIACIIADFFKGSWKIVGRSSSYCMPENVNWNNPKTKLNL